MRRHRIACALGIGCLLSVAAARPAAVEADRLEQTNPPRPPRPPDPPRPSGNQQMERFTQRLRLHPNGSVRLSNVAGDITVVVGATDDVLIEATKWTSGSGRDLADIEIRVRTAGNDIHIETEAGRRATDLLRSRNRVDYVVAAPRWAALDIKTFAGSVQVSDIQGSIHAQSVSGSITATNTPGVESLQTVSGSIELTGANGTQSLKTVAVSGSIRATNVRVDAWDAQSVSGSISLVNVRCRRLDAKSLSGSVSFSGDLDPRGRYEVQTFSGSVHFSPSNVIGFDVNASSFSGTVRSRMNLTAGGNQNNRSLSGRIGGGGGATVSINTFSGEIDIGGR
jgi:DUF4097 and DUF4098 domain-containing protein YvlB